MRQCLKFSGIFLIVAINWYKYTNTQGHTASAPKKSCHCWFFMWNFHSLLVFGSRKPAKTGKILRNSRSCKALQKLHRKICFTTQSHLLFHRFHLIIYDNWNFHFSCWGNESLGAHKWNSTDKAKEDSIIDRVVRNLIFFADFFPYFTFLEKEIFWEKERICLTNEGIKF